MMEFRERYLCALREQTPTTYRGLHNSGEMNDHLDVVDREAADMLQALLLSEPKGADGRPLDNMQHAIARELVFLGLTSFDEPDESADAEAVDHGGERTSRRKGDPNGLGQQVEPAAPAGIHAADPNREKVSDWILRLLSNALWVAGGFVPLLMVGAAWLFPTRSALVVVGFYDPVTELALLTMKICIFILVPAAFIPATRGFARLGLWASAWIFGITLWLTSYVGVYQIWGRTAATVGVLIGIVGIEPEALVAALRKPDRMGAISVIMLASAWLGAFVLERQVVKWRLGPAAAKSGKSGPVKKREDSASVAAGAAFYLALFSAFTALPVAGWVTHIFECVADRRWNYLMTGMFAFPVGVVHGWALWFGWFR